MIKLELDNKDVEVYLVTVHDELEPKVGKIVTKVVTEEIVEEQPVKSGYEIIIPFSYEETWDDTTVINFAKEQLNKRFK